MLPFAQSANVARVTTARERLAEIKLRSHSDRAIARKAAYAEEERAGRAGVVTINQADATYMDLNVHAFDTMSEAFGEWADLQFGQAAIYKTRQEYAVRVNIGTLAGGPPAVNFATKQSAVQVQPFQYFSEKFLVPNLVNAAFNLDKFKEKEIALNRQARDMRLARQQYVINTMLGQPLATPLATSIPAYVLTTPFNGRTPYVLDAGVQSGSVPTTNIIDVHSTEGGLTRGMFKKLATYLTLASRSPRALFIAKAGNPWESYWDQASIVGYSTGNQDPARAITPSRWEEAVGTSFAENGLYMNWFGVQQFVQPVNNLPAGYALQATDQPAVLGWNQLEMSESDEQGLFGDRSYNERYEARSIALAVPDPLLLNAAVVRYA